MLLSLVNSAEKPMGIELLEKTGRRSTWTLPREWVQNTQPELAVVTKYLDDHAAHGATIGRDARRLVRQFVYVGYPDIDHRIVYADSLGEAASRSAERAVLPLSAIREPGWELGLRSPPWAVYRHVPRSSCR